MPDKKKGLVCPKCLKDQWCPCEACKERHGQEIVWVWDKTGEIVSCGHCGHTMTAGDWLDEEWKQIMVGVKPKGDKLLKIKGALLDKAGAEWAKNTDESRARSKLLMVDAQEIDTRYKNSFYRQGRYEEAEKELT